MKQKIAILLTLAIIMTNISLIYADWKVDKDASYKKTYDDGSTYEYINETLAGGNMKETIVSTENSGGELGGSNVVLGSETPLTTNVNESWVGFYKNFIFELGGIEMTFYATTGAPIKTYKILLKSFSGSSYNAKRPMIRGEKDIILEGDKQHILSLSGYKFSDYIPILTQYDRAGMTKEESHLSLLDDSEGDDSLREANFTYFNYPDDPKPFETWITENEGENLNALCKDIGANLDGKTAIEWLGQKDKDGKTPSIVMAPLTFYPYTSEQIYCNKEDIARKNFLQYDVAYGQTLEELYKGQSTTETSIDRKEYSKAEVEELAADWFTSGLSYEELKVGQGEAGAKKIFDDYVEVTELKYDSQTKKYIGTGVNAKGVFGFIADVINTVKDLFNKRIYYDIGVLQLKDGEVNYKSGMGERTISENEMRQNFLQWRFSGEFTWEDAQKTLGDKLQKEYQDFIKNSINAEKKGDGYLVRADNSGISNAAVGYRAFNIKVQEPTYKDLTWYKTTSHVVSFNAGGWWAKLLKKEGRIECEYEIMELDYKHWLYSQDYAATDNFSSITKSDIDKYAAKDGWKWDNSKNVYWKGDLKDGSKLSTDHNQYIVAITKSANEDILKIEEMLAQKGVLYASPINNVYMHGAVLLTGYGFSIATSSVITRVQRGDYGGLPFPNAIELMEDEIAYPFELTTNQRGKFSGDFNVERTQHANGSFCYSIVKDNGDEKEFYHSCSIKMTSGRNFSYLIEDTSNYNTSNLLSAEPNHTYQQGELFSREGGSIGYGGINHKFTGYRDKERDLRTLYPFDGLTEEERAEQETNGTEADFASFGITQSTNNIPNAFMITEGATKLELGHPAGFSVSVDGETDACEWECNKEECSGGGCDGGEAHIINSSSEESALIRDNSFTFTQWVNVGKGATATKINPPVKNTVPIGWKTEGSSNVLVFNWAGQQYGYKNANNTGNTVGQNFAQKSDIKFYPYVNMRYGTQSKKRWMNAYIMSENESTIPRSVVVNVAKRKHTEPNIFLDSRWSMWASAMDNAHIAGIQDKNSITTGGSLMTLYTQTSEDRGAKSDNVAGCDLGIMAFEVCVPDDRQQFFVQADKTVSDAKTDMEAFRDEALENLNSYNIEMWGVEGVYRDMASFKDKASCVDNGGSDVSRQVNKFGGNNLNRSQGKYYLEYESDEPGNDSKVNAELTSENITVFTITSDTKGTVHLFTDGVEVGSFEGKSYNAATSLTDFDWQEMNQVNGFVDNFVTSLDFAANKGGKVRTADRNEWYNEAINGISCVRGIFKYTIGFDESRFEVLDPALAGKQTEKNEMYNSSEADKNWRTFRFQLSPNGAGLQGDNSKGYIGTLDGVEVYCNNMDELLYSKLFYMGNTTVYDIN